MFVRRPDEHRHQDEQAREASQDHGEAHQSLVVLVGAMEDENAQGDASEEYANDRERHESLGGVNPGGCPQFPAVVADFLSASGPEASMAVGASRPVGGSIGDGDHGTNAEDQNQAGFDVLGRRMKPGHFCLCCTSSLYPQ